MSVMGLCGSTKCGCGLTVADGLELSGSGTGGDPWVLGAPSGLIVGGLGWEPIDNGYVSSGSDIYMSIPSGQFELVRVHYTATFVATGGTFQIRVNNDSTAGLHISSESRFQTDGTVVTHFDGLSGTYYRITQPTTTLQHWGHFTISGTRVASLLSIYGTCYHQGIPNASRRIEHYGVLNASRTLSSLRINSGIDDFGPTHWWLEGYRIP